MDYLSNTSLFYSSEGLKNSQITLSEEEYHHAVKVLRLREGDKINITDGRGNIYYCEITEIKSSLLEAKVQEQKYYKNVLEMIRFAIPLLKSQERFEFALEKCTELGITDFLIYSPVRSPKVKFRKDRIEKISLAAMKQSLRPYLPRFKFVDFIADGCDNFERIVLEQGSGSKFSELELTQNKEYLFVVGPEAGLDEKEIERLKPFSTFSLNPARLRSETAAVSAAVLLNSLIFNID